MKFTALLFYLLFPALVAGSIAVREPVCNFYFLSEVPVNSDSLPSDKTNSENIFMVTGPLPGSETDSMLFYDIPEVVIEESRNSFFHEDKKLSTPDSLIKAVFSNSDAGRLLSLFTTAYVNSSGGPGSSASVSLRGTNSYQTTVKWNGFPLNSLSLGTMDFSLVPVTAADDISVLHGAAGSIAGSGNFGGSVLLRNKADWSNRLHIGVKSDLGTYDNKHFSLSGKMGNERFQYQLLMFSHQAKNNFRYTDNYKAGGPVETMQNNALDNKAVLQNLFLKLPGNNKIETGIWYQARKKEIPAIMGSFLPANAIQRDSTLRVYAKWTKRWNRSSFSLNSAVFDEHMLYRDKGINTDNNYSIDSKIHSTRLLGDINYRVWISDFFLVDGGMEISSLSANIDAYGKRVNEIRPAAISAFKLKLPGFISNLSLRKEFQENIDIPLLFSAGVRKEMPVGGLAVKSSYSDQFRIPTFNDRYWQPGGNPQLLPESGYTADIGLIQNIESWAGHQLSIELNGYQSKIKNMIQWVPSQSSSWWNPENRKEVMIRGVESSLSSAGNMGMTRYKAVLSYNYVTSLIRSVYNGEGANEGNQLMYVPRHNLSSHVNFYFKKSFLGFTGNYTGIRYTGNDNNPVYMMPSYIIFNSYAGYRLKVGDISGQLLLRVMNLFNAQYQVVRSYAMPGRTFYLSFSLELNQYQ